MFEIFTWDVGGVSQDLFMTNEHELLWERHDACGAGSAALKPSLICWGPTPTLLMEPPSVFRLRDRSVCQALCAAASSEAHPEFLRAGRGRGWGTVPGRDCFLVGVMLGEKTRLDSSVTCLAVPTCLPSAISQTENTISKIDSTGVISVQRGSIAIHFCIPIE